MLRKAVRDSGSTERWRAGGHPIVAIWGRIGAILVAFAVLVAAAQADAAPRRKATKPVQDRYAAIVLDARTGEVLHEANADA